MKFYTYTHATPDGDIFYVGKGAGHRAYSTNKRPIAWREMVSKHDGICVKIVSRFETEQEAFEHEKYLIKKYRSEGASLLNLTDGGLGVLGYCQTEELRARKSEMMTGYVHKIVTCPHCGTTGGETSMRRWHFDNCKGARIFKARVTVGGKRVFLGNYATKEAVEVAKSSFLAKVG